ncbi:MAG: CPBP family intramembrane metalloprotease [Dysgonamonadaceae bacterium]|nr:CPBP family intramembrane metalloprotease [Dysgonamonadaceae bacterium]
MLIVFFLTQLILPWYIAHFGDFEGPEKVDSLFLTIMISVIIVPVIETLLCQLLPIYLLSYLKNIPYWVLIFISSLCFGLQHLYCVLYILYGFIGGWILATAFLIFKKQKDYFFAVVLTATIHGVFNLIMSVVFDL